MLSISFRCYIAINVHRLNFRSFHFGLSFCNYIGKKLFQECTLVLLCWFVWSFHDYICAECVWCTRLTEIQDKECCWLGSSRPTWYSCPVVWHCPGSMGHTCHFPSPSLHGVVVQDLAHFQTPCSLCSLLWRNGNQYFDVHLSSSALPEYSPGCQKQAFGHCLLNSQEGTGVVLHHLDTCCWPCTALGGQQHHRCFSCGLSQTHQAFCKDMCGLWLLLKFLILQVLPVKYNIVNNYYYLSETKLRKFNWDFKTTQKPRLVLPWCCKVVYSNSVHLNCSHQSTIANFKFADYYY